MDKNLEITKIAIFRKKEIRKRIYKNEWWFSVLDVVGVLTDSPQPKTYWAKMKERDREMSQPFPFWEQLKLQSVDGKMRETDCANTEGLFRIVQSIPSSKAEPFTPLDNFKISNGVNNLKCFTYISYKA